MSTNLDRTSSYFFPREPNINIMTTCLYFKINDKVEIAACLQGNWRTREFLNEKYEVGIKLKHTDNLTFGFKINFDGNISTGVWYIADGNITKINNKSVDPTELFF